MALKRCSITMTLCFVFCLVECAQASYFGRFDLGAFSVVPDDADADARVSSSGRLMFGWESADRDTWSILADLRLRAEPGVEGAPHYMVWDLRADYGLGKSIIAGSLGMCRMNEVSGIGSILGGHLQINPVSGLSLGLFGGGNPFTYEGHLDIDGARFGAYARYAIGSDLRMGVAFTSISGTDQPEDERDIVVFDSQFAIASRFYFNHFGEITLARDEESTRLSYYYANARFDLTQRIRFSAGYNHFEYLPYIQFQDEIEFYDQDSTPSFSRVAEYSSDSLSPRIEFKITSTWRLYARYRHQSTDYFTGSDTDQWLGGVSCSNLLRSGVSFNGSFGTTNRQDRDFTNTYVSISRDFGRSLNVTFGYAMDRYNRPESVFVSRHQESTQRASASVWYRFNDAINFLVDYEKSFADSDQGDHQIMFNVQYRLR